MMSALGPRRLLHKPTDWLVHDQGIEPHIPLIDKSGRIDGTFSRIDVVYDDFARDIARTDATSTPSAGGTRSRCCSPNSGAFGSWAAYA